MIYFYYANYILVSMVLGILAVIYLIITEILLFSRKLYVTTYGVSERLGLLSRKLITVDMEDIINVTITQNIWQRMLNYGEVFVNTTEQKKEEEVVFPAATNPEKVKKLLKKS